MSDSAVHCDIGPMTHTRIHPIIGLNPVLNEGFMMNNVIRVWDPLVRIFHWGLVLAFAVAYLSGDEENSVHIYSGYIVAGLIAFRLVWGMVGTRYARFSNFIYSPRTIIQYLNGLLAGKPKHYIGHNPAGGWMIIALLATLSVVTVSGLKVYAIEEGRGPLAVDMPSMSLVSQAFADSDDDDHDKHEKGHHDDEEEFWEEIHELASDFMLLLIVLHVAGVVVAGRLHAENLVKAMITGKKTDNIDA
jgi:cytochrome b